MGAWVHRIVDGACIACPDVPVVWKSSHNRYICANSKRKHKGKTASQRRRAALGRPSDKCAICQEVMDEPQADHDHATGKPRDYLCRGCNLGLGFFRDNPEALRAAAAYVEHHR